MNRIPDISIIIPVFNGEKFLKRCLESIINQSFYNIEIIIVNDGSTDRTLEICKKISEKDRRFKIINQENAGVSTARNVGLDIASGKYIYFVDADDFVTTDGIYKIFNKAESENLDLVIAGYITNHYEKNIIKLPIYCENNENFIYTLLSGKNHSALWCKLFKKDLFNSVRFSKNLSYMEDRALILDLLIKCQPRIGFLMHPIYMYWQDKNSVTNSKDLRILKILDTHIYIGELLTQSNFNKKIKDIYTYKAYRSIYFIFNNIEKKYIKQAIDSVFIFYEKITSMGYMSSDIIYRIIFKLPKEIIYLILNLFKSIINK